MTITNFELAALAKQYNVNLKLKDIIMMEDLDDVKCAKNMNLILNYQGAGVRGVGHFVAFVVRDMNAFYMDSFGGKPLEDVVEYCKKHGLKLGYNGTVIQPMDSTNCGVYCFAFLLYLKQGGDLFELCNRFVNLFNKRKVEGNDDKLHKFLEGQGIRHDYK